MEPNPEEADLPIKTLLVGMGNPYLTDDAVGIRLVRDFKRRLGEMPNLDVIEECSVGGLNFLDLLDGFRRLIIVDSIRTKGGIPGSWHRFTAERLRETMNIRNIHDVNLATALELGHRMGMKIPSESETHILAVEILDDSTFGEQLTDELERAYPIYSSEIFGDLCFLICPKPP